MGTEHKFKDYFEGVETGDMCENCGFKMVSRAGSCNVMYVNEFFCSDSYLKCNKTNSIPCSQGKNIINQ